jgi:branched-chain amino acid transport system substrate-binding protein
MRRVSLVGLVLVGALILSLPAALAQADKGGGTAAVPGISARTITIGGTFPLSGAASSYAPIAVGMKAYFSYVNARRGPDGKRGIGGRQVNFIYYDDGYNPVNSIQLTRKLVQQDKVFAVVGTLGTEVNQAVRPYLNSVKVPHVLVASGMSEWGTKHQEFPWTIGFQPDYILEGRLYGLHIAKNHPSAKIGIFFQNDSYGQDYIRGFRAGLGSKTSLIVAQEPFDLLSTPDPRSQIARLKASGADTFMIFATPRPTIQAYAFARALAWKPAQTYVNSVSATDAFMTAAIGSSSPDWVNGSISAAIFKDPASAAFDSDPAMRRYREIMAKYNPGGRTTDGLYVYGFALADTFVQAMVKAGPNPTRAGLMKALLSLDSENPWSLPGTRMKTSARDHFILSDLQLQQFTSGTWRPIGPVVKGRPKG